MGNRIMKYIYVNESESRVVLIAQKPSAETISNDCAEYIISDAFDLSKEMSDDDGNPIHLDGFLTASEFLERYRADYVSQRVGFYPPIEDYLDAVVKEDAEAIEKYRSDCLAVKLKYPKPTA